MDHLDTDSGTAPLEADPTVSESVDGHPQSDSGDVDVLVTPEEDIVSPNVGPNQRVATAGENGVQLLDTNNGGDVENMKVAGACGETSDNKDSALSEVVTEILKDVVSAGLEQPSSVETQQQVLSVPGGNETTMMTQEEKGEEPPDGRDDTKENVKEAKLDQSQNKGENNERDASTLQDDQPLLSRDSITEETGQTEEIKSETGPSTPAPEAVESPSKTSCKEIGQNDLFPSADSKSETIGEPVEEEDLSTTPAQPVDADTVKNQNVMPGMDTELDDFFASSPWAVSSLRADVGEPCPKPETAAAEETLVENLPQSNVPAEKQGHFPALDNVDLETDEELLEVEKLDATATENQSPDKQEGNEDNKKISELLAREDCKQGGGEESESDLHNAVYTNNYKVCRELQPGLKECLILETGEQYICVDSTHKHQQSNIVEVPGRESPVLNVHSEDHDNTTGRHEDDLHLSFEDKLDTDYGLSPQLYRTTHPTLLRIHGEVLSPAEAFAYVSFDDGGSVGGGGGSQGFTSLDDGEQAFFTSNGIPVILDNAEDDVKLNLRAGGKRSMPPSHTRDLGSERRSYDKITQTAQHDSRSTQQTVNRRELEVAELLASSMEGTDKEKEDEEKDIYVWRKRKNKPKSKKKKEESVKFVELEPDSASDNDDARGLRDRDVQMVGETNGRPLDRNNSSDAQQDENNSANDKIYRGTYTIPDTKHGREAGDVRSSKSSRDRSGLDYPHQVDSFIHSPKGHSNNVSHCSSYLKDSRDYTSSLNRYGDPSSIDSTRLSTRYSRIERGDSRSPKAESSTVPKFNTLHDQQMSWLDMFKMIEAQHRKELKAQHAQHEQLLLEMQEKMARELSRQQDTLKHSLSAHREILEELSPGRSLDLAQNKNQSRKFDDADGSSCDGQRSVTSSVDNSSHTTLQGVDIALRNPPPVSRYQEHYGRNPDNIPVRRSRESELSSPSRPADTSLPRHTEYVGLGRDKQLRGGVYSSPMPLAKSKHKNFSRANKSHSDTTASLSPADEKSRNSNAVHKLELNEDSHEEDSCGGVRQAGQGFQGLVDPVNVSQADTDDSLSPRTRISLREKHARHMADLRAYYEEELLDMRRQLQAAQRKLDRGHGSTGSLSGSKGQDELHVTSEAVSVQEQILTKENEELRQRCRQLQDDNHDGQSEIRELQQKMQGLEIRAADYAERYDQSQAQVLSLGARLEELTEFAKEKESSCEDAQIKSKRVAESLQLAYKKEKELTESLHNAKTTIQRLVDKYEMLEKDYTILKETSAANQEKLHDSRQEAMEVNNKLSRLEMDNKQLQHDNEILQHDLTMARNSITMRTSYEDSYNPPRVTERPERAYQNSTVNTRSRSRDRTQHNSSPTPDPRSRARPASPEDSSTDSLRSPILRAEQELRKLQSSGGGVSGAGRDYAPRLQRKFYGTELSTTGIASNNKVSPNNRNRASFSPNSRIRSSMERKGPTTPTGRGRGSRATTPQRPSSSSKAEPFNFVTERERSGQDRNLRGSSEKRLRDSTTDKDTSNASRKLAFSTNGMSGDQAMEKIKSGDIVSRPDWEDVYTSMTGSRPGSSGTNRAKDRSSSRDRMLQERVRNIDNLEKKYDDLVHQKRKYESSLSKLPVHGHRGEKDRLEAELDKLDRELGSVRMSLKRFHVLKSTI